MSSSMYKKPEGLTLASNIRINIFPVIASLLNSVGFSWKTLGRSILGRNTLIAQGKKISQTLVKGNIDNPLNIYILSMLGSHAHNLSVDVVLSWGLIKKGHNVTLVLDDQFLPINEERKAGDESTWKQTSAASYAFGLNYLRACGLNVKTLSQLIEHDDYRDISAFKSIVEATILKHYKVGVIEGELPGLELKKKQIERSVEISALLGDYIKTQKADRVIMSHGIYSTWGPAFQILDEAKVPIVTYSKTKRKKTEKFNWNHTGDWWDVDNEWKRVKNVPLTKEQEQKIDAYLKSRITHSEDVLIYNFGDLETKSESYKRFNLDPSKPVFTLFTNVLWDAASTQREIAFNDPVHWVFETLKWFINNPEKQLIVKIHPAEVVIGTNQPFANIIRAKFPSLPANIRLIEPTEKVNSWSIYDITTLGLVHTTTAGMELPLVGIPCAVVSRTHYRSKGFTIDVQSKEEYFNLLTQSSIFYNIEESKVLAKRYAYLLFERYQMPFDVFDEPRWTDVRSLTFNSIDELMAKPYFEYIIDAIINKKEFLTEA